MTFRRKLRFAFLVVFAALAGWAGLTWYRHSQAEQAVAALRLMKDVLVKETHKPPDWWRRIAAFVGIAPERGPFVRTTLWVATATKEALPVAARHPDLDSLEITGARGLDDDAFGAVRGCDSVTNLYLKDVGIGDAGLRHLAGWTRLRTVWVDGCPITDEGIRYLCGLPSVEVITCQGPGLKLCEVHGLALAGPDGAAATAAYKTPTVKGRLVLTASPPKGGVREVKVLVTHTRGQMSVGTGAVAPDGSFAVTAANGNNVLRTGLNLVSVEVRLLGPPAVVYCLPPVTFDVLPPD